MAQSLLDVDVKADELLIYIRRAQRADAADESLRLAGEAFVEKMRVPPPERHAKQPFVNDRHRRGFFYYLNRGEIEVPYRRGLSPGSEQVTKKWRVIRLTDGHYIVTNEASYADLLHGKRRTRYHARTGWLTIEQGWRRYGAEIKRRWRGSNRRFVTKG